MPDYDPLTISDEELKALPPAERGAGVQSPRRSTQCRRRGACGWRSSGGSDIPCRRDTPCPSDARGWGDTRGG